MPDVPQLPAPGARERVSIESNAGLLQAVVSTPREQALGIMVVCHPHPLYGGTMDNKVVTTLDQVARETGCAALRFNFRGVGESEGVHDDGKGEVEDALAAMSLASRLLPDAPLLLAGFSFGGAMALRAALRTVPAQLVTVAPALNYWGGETVTAPECPWLLIHGDADEVVDCSDTLRRAREAQPTPDIVVLEGVGHFFHGRLRDLREQIAPVLQAVLAS